MINYFLPRDIQIFHFIALYLVLWMQGQVTKDIYLNRQMKIALSVTCMIGTMIIIMEFFINRFTRAFWLKNQMIINDYVLIKVLFTIKYMLLILLPVSTLYVSEKDKYKRSNAGIFVGFTISVYITLLVFNFFYPIIFTITKNGKFINEQYWIIRCLLLFAVYSLTIGITFRKKYGLTEQEKSSMWIMVVLFWLCVYATEVKYHGYMTGLFVSLGLMALINVFHTLAYKICPLTQLPKIDVLFSEIENDKKYDNHTVFIFSVLGLKEINKKDGRDKGDYYLRAVTKTIADELSYYGKAYRTRGNGLIIISKEPRAVYSKIKQLENQQYTSKQYGVYPMNFKLGRTLTVRKQYGRSIIGQIIAACDHAED